MMKSVTMKVMVMIGMMGLMACGASPSASVPVHVSFPMFKSILATLSGVSLTVSGADMTTVTSSQAGPFADTISFSLDVPTGVSRSFTAVAAISGASKIGYEGTATSDIVATGNTVPITMLFMNFASNSVAAINSGPQLSAVSVGYDGALISLTIDFSSPILLGHTAGVVEFLPKTGGTTRSQSIITELKGSVDVTMPAAGTNYMMFNGTVNGVEVILYDSTDQSMSVPAGATFDAVQTSQTSITMSMSTTAFQSLVDSTVDGALNVLVGGKAGPNLFLTPTTTSVFTPSSAAVGTTSGNVMLYDGSFDTTGLQ